MIGIAAAETGFKACVAELIPEADWLIFNVPAPPLMTMLSKFLPQLSTKLKIKDKVLPPPKEMMKILEDGVKLRNDIAHKKTPTIPEKKVHDLLKAVHDLLYLLDYYCGHKWAENNISYENTVSLTK